MFLSIYHSGYVPEPLSGPPLIDCRDSVLSLTPLGGGTVWCCVVPTDGDDGHGGGSALRVLVDEPKQTQQKIAYQTRRLVTAAVKRIEIHVSEGCLQYSAATQKRPSGLYCAEE